MRNIILVPYDYSWQEAFNQIKEHLESEIKDKILAIEHIGSTSIEALDAKPIIDIDIIIESYDVFPEIVHRLKKLGYTHNGDQGIKEREAFKYDSSPFMTHHLYVCPKDSIELKKHLAFRDYLRKHPFMRDEYSKIKALAAQKYPHDIDGYLAFKGQFILKIYKELGL
ncbi:MAG: GrpB family protein [Candidatus Izemoplasmatales bacterium]